jgi:hypothetical protein
VYAVYSWRFNKDREFEKITRALAHEIAEACTNPGPGDAFIDPDADPDDDYEIADFCEKEAATVNGEKVEGYWSNLDGGCVIPGKE